MKATLRRKPASVCLFLLLAIPARHDGQAAFVPSTNIRRCNDNFRFYGKTTAMSGSSSSSGDQSQQKASSSSSKRKPNKRNRRSSTSTSSTTVEQTKDSSTTAAKSKHERQPPPMEPYPAKYLEDNGLELSSDPQGHLVVTPKESLALSSPTSLKAAEQDTTKQSSKSAPDKNHHHHHRPQVKDQPAKIVPTTGFNVVLTHATADFDSLASAVGLAKLWSPSTSYSNSTSKSLSEEDRLKKDYDSASHLPTFVVLPRGAHPSVQRFLALHKYLFPIRSLKSLPSDLSGLNRLGLVDAQRRERIGPAAHLLEYAKRITVVDHHVDMDTDLQATDYVVDKVGSVSTLIVERLREQQEEHEANSDTSFSLTEAEATLLALGIHADTGSLCFDSTTPRDASALAWVMEQGASQAAIAEHATASLSAEQQGVLTQALINTNSTKVHGVTVSTVLLAADGFINGLAAVTQDALDLSSSDVYLLGLVYEARSGGSRKKHVSESIQSRLLHAGDGESMATEDMFNAEGWRGGDEALLRRKLRAAFDRCDLNNSGCLDKDEVSATLSASGIIATEATVNELMTVMDSDGDGRVDFEEFVDFAKNIQENQQAEAAKSKKSSTLIIIGRAKPGVNMRSVNLGKLLEKYGGGGHAKAASATVRLNTDDEADGIMTGLVEELIDKSLNDQPTVGDFMTAPVLSVKPDMTESQVEALFDRFDVRALPVVDDDNNVIGLVTYKEVAAAKQRMWNKEQKRLRQLRARQEMEGGENSNYDASPEEAAKSEERRKKGTTVKGWMKQHVKTVETTATMAEVEAMLLENDVGCIPVVAVGTMQLLGMVTRTDLLRQHRYYPSLIYHNKGFSDSIAARKPILELRKRLKKFDLD